MKIVNRYKEHQQVDSVLPESMASRDNEDLVARIEDDPIVQALGSRPRFIPLRHGDLRDDLISRYEFGAQDKARFLSICAKLQQIFHAEHLSQLLQLEEIYSPLDPDSQILEIEDSDESERRILTEKLFDRVSGLLFSAHYKRLDRTELERAVEVASQWNVRLDVDFELYDRLEVFARGYHAITVERRRWTNFFRVEKIELPEFERLIMAFRLKQPPTPKPTKADNEKTEEDKQNTRRKKLARRISKLLKGNDDDAMSEKYVYLKTFKNIPETDLEVLLPGSKVKLSMLDRGKILLPTAMIFFKISRFFAIFVAVFTAILAAQFVLDDIFTLIMIGGAIAGYIVKSILSYFRTKDKYQFGLTKNLYLKNLGNNSGVLYRILNEAEEQELLETILGYTVLWQAADKAKQSHVRFEGLSSEEIDEQCEKYLKDLTEVDIDFEVFDSLGKLARLGLADVDAKGRWSAVPVEQAGDNLDASWKRLFQARGMRVEFEPQDRETGAPLPSSLPESDLFTG